MDMARRPRYDSVASVSIDSDADTADVNEIWLDFRANGRDSDLDDPTTVTTLAREIFGGEFYRRILYFLVALFRAIYSWIRTICVKSQLQDAAAFYG